MRIIEWVKRTAGSQKNSTMPPERGEVLDKALYARAKAEVYRVSTFEGFRSEPPTRLEIGLGFAAFLVWTKKGMEIKNSRYTNGLDETAWKMAMDNYFGAANESARNVAIQFVEYLATSPSKYLTCVNVPLECPATTGLA